MVILKHNYLFDSGKELEELQGMVINGHKDALYKYLNRRPTFGPN